MDMLKDIKHVMLIEDNEGDIYLLKAAFEELGCTFTLHVEQDGESAIQYLTRAGKKQDAAEIPQLILLDFNIPRYNGHEVLQSVRALEAFKQVPILIFSSSSNPAEIRASYEKGATGHIKKSFYFEETVAQIKTILSHCPPV